MITHSFKPSTRLLAKWTERMALKPGVHTSIYILLTSLVVACGGNDNPHTVIPSYDIGGTISGLNGSVVLQINGRTEITLTEDGEFVFPNSFKSGRDYDVTVLYPPLNNSCSVTNGKGTVANNHVTNITVSCALPSSPNLTIEALGKQIKFSWPSVAGSTLYKLYENPDGKSGFTQLGEDLTATTYTKSVSVHKLDWANVRYLAEACTEALCSVSSNEVSASTLDEQAIAYFKASTTGPGNQFGTAIALSADGNTLAVGSPYDPSNGYASGAVYIFSRDTTGTWQQDAYITNASYNGEGDQLGFSLALSNDGNTLAIGAPGESSDGTADNNLALFSGSVYIFRRTDGTWSEQARIKANNFEAGDRFGSSVTLSGNDGNLLAVGATFESSDASGINQDPANNNAIWSGAAYIFNYFNDNWTQQAYIKASNADAHDLFGHAIKLNDDGRILAVSAINEASDGSSAMNNAAGGAGAVYIFELSTAWTQTAYLKASSPDINDNFGYALDFNAQGNLLAVGAPGESSNHSGVNEEQTNNEARSSGAAYLFTFTNSWTQTAYIKASNSEAGDRFAHALALNAIGNELAVSAIFESSSATGINGDESNNDSNTSGAVYFFQSTEQWQQHRYIKAPNTDTGDHFGQSVELDDTGDTLAVGVKYESSAAVGIGGNILDNQATGSGAVFLY